MGETLVVMVIFVLTLKDYRYKIMRTKHIISLH